MPKVNKEQIDAALKESRKGYGVFSFPILLFKYVIKTILKTKPSKAISGLSSVEIKETTEKVSVSKQTDE